MTGSSAVREVAEPGDSLAPGRRSRSRRPFADFDWDTRSCGRHGHATYQPDEPALAARLSTTTPVGDAWRCLRCGDYVVGPPRGRGPADDAPIVLRGRALRDAFVLRLLAVERGLRGLVLVALGYGVWKFNGAKQSLQQVFESYLPAVKPLADRLGVDLTATGPVHTVEKLFRMGKGTLYFVALGIVAYGVLELTEAVGLWLMRRWGEYVAVVGTSLFIPLEVYEIAEKVTWLRVGALLLNLFAVGYILWTKRLFGVRGGWAAFERQRHSDSLLEVERAAVRDEAGDGGGDEGGDEDSNQLSGQVSAATTWSAAR